MTPEGKVKDLTKKFLIAKGLIPAGKAVEATKDNSGWFFLPVSGGLGVHGIPDILCHYKGRFFAIETKVPDKDPTPLQKHQLRALQLTGAAVFVVRCEENLKLIDKFLTDVDSSVRL